MQEKKRYVVARNEAFMSCQNSELAYDVEAKWCRENPMETSDSRRPLRQILS